MPALNLDQRLKVESMIEDMNVINYPRPYLGISSIGDECPRKLWYGFRLCAKDINSARMHRLFQRGHREENIIKADLRKIGIIHHSDQKEVVDCHGHVKGHIDDILERIPDAPKTPHLGEYKTHNEKSFNDLMKNKLEKSKPVHFIQMQCYMYKLNLKRGLYIAVNKNNDARYYERIYLDKGIGKDYLTRGESIISTEIPPQKIGNETWYKCKWCRFYGICHNGELPLKNCRTCKYADIHDEGKWKCSGYRLWLTFEQQVLGCIKHKYLKGLIP